MDNHHSHNLTRNNVPTTTSQSTTDLDDDISGHWIEMKEDNSPHSSMGGGMSSSMEGLQTSRFRVNPVEGTGGSSQEDVNDGLGSSPTGRTGSGRRQRHRNLSSSQEEFSSPVGSFANRTITHGTLGYSTSYDTKNTMKSLRHYTRDALPRADHYRNIMSVHGHMSRPTMDELHGGQMTVIVDTVTGRKSIASPESATVAVVDGAIKFGWIQGVLIRCLLNIWGVMLFIRLPWVVANAGIGFACVIILLASLVTTITALSMSAICTNGVVKGGGTYYMISRSLGPEFGGSIGVIFAIANAVAIAMYSVGFAETFRELLLTEGIEVTGDKWNDIRIISCIAVCVLLAIALIGTEWESKAQMVLLVILLAAMADFMIGSLIPPSLEQQSKGYVGWSVRLLKENFPPNYRKEQTFFSVFSVFFPAATGILAGANISGDLKDPQRAIPLGTLLAIAITTASYLLFAFLAGALVLRDANGLNLDSIGNGGISASSSWDERVDFISNCSLIAGNKCDWGTQNYMMVIEMVALFGPVIYAGIFAATLSSALASLVSAPKVFQALCQDKLFPYIDYFGLGYGKNNEPRRGYILAFIVAIGCCLIGDLDIIAPIISNFFLAAYCLINFSCFHASFAKSLGFRPSFRYYNMWVSLGGFFLCLAVMFLTGWIAALTTFVLVGALFMWVQYRKPDVNWGSSTQAQTYRSAVQSLHKLSQLPEHVKNYRPQILVLSGNPSDRPALVDFAYHVTRGGIGMLICGNAANRPLNQRTRNVLTQSANDWLLKRKIKGFYALSDEESFSKGVRAMLSSVGVGKLRPNLVLLGFKNNWQSCPIEEIQEYFQVIHDSFDHHLALAILRLPTGLDCSRYGKVTDIAACFDDKGKSFLNNSFVSVEVLSKDETTDQSSSNGNNSSHHLSPPSNRNGDTSSDNSRESTPSPLMEVRRSQSQGVILVPESESSNSSRLNHNHNHHQHIPREIPKDILAAVNQFQRKQRKGTIDVWWLYDDGGLTMLLPYILSTRSQWSSCRLRVFSLASKRDQLDREQRNMAALLNKFRIDYSDVTVIPDVVRSPRPESKQRFFELISKFRVRDEKEEGSGDNTSGDVDQQQNQHNDKASRCHSGLITESELVALKDKIARHLRLHELVHENSHESSLVVMTLSMPRKGTVSAAMYLTWLELLTERMPCPFLLIRGNQTSVLTFYS